MGREPRPQVHKPVPPDGTPISQLSIHELQHELQRRIKKLEEKREEHLQRAAEIEDELRSLGVIIDVDGRGKKKVTRKTGRGLAKASRPGSSVKTLAWETRRANRQPLVEVLTQVLNGYALTTREAADAVLGAGYVTQSKNFANSVGVALYKDERFVKKGKQWCLKR